MRYSILELYDTETGERREIARFDWNIEAPFFRSDNELCYNADGIIYRMWLDTQEVDELPTGTCRACNNDHVFSPCGKYIAVSNGDRGFGSRIWLVDLEGKNPPRLVTEKAPSYLHGYSPDGKTLAYCAERNGDYDVYTISTDGGEEIRLTDTIGLDDGPEYSPDGTYIYFNSVRSGMMECWRMDADGKNPVKLTENGRHNWFPHISPDNSKIVYISYDPEEVRAGDHPPDKNVQIRMMNPDGTDDRCLIEFFGGQGSFNVNSWMPGSRYFAFVRYEIV